MASEAAAAKDIPIKQHPRKQNKQDELKGYRSIFDVSPDYFDSCRLLQSPLISLPDSDSLNEESQLDNEVTKSSNYGSNAKIMQRWSCNTCKAEFESLEDQRFHFKSDLHRFNIKLCIAGKSIIKEEDFDASTSDLCEYYDVSSISGSEDEDERENRDRQLEVGGISKTKLFIQLQTGERVAIWRCLLLRDSEKISFENDKSFLMNGAGNTLCLTQMEMMEKLKYIIHEPRDNTHLRIVLLARGGHFAGCVFDGNSVVAHKTFHRYVVRAKAGKMQSSKDGGGGRVIHSAGASLRRYNELGLKKDIQELFTLWKPYFSAASCIFIYAPSNNRQLFFDGEKPYFVSQHNAIRNIPLTVRRPTSKEARRIYNLLTQISTVITEERSVTTTEESLTPANIESYNYPKSSETELKESSKDTKVAESSSIEKEMDGLSMSIEPKKEPENVGTTTLLHEAAKMGDAEKVLELLEEGLDPCIKDERGHTPYMLAGEKEVRNNFRRFMALNLEKWDWQAAKVPSALTKEMEESQAAKQAEKDAKKKAKAKELKKLRKAKEKKAQAEAAQSQNASTKSGSSGAGSDHKHKGNRQSSGSLILSKEEKIRRNQEDEREKRAAAAERRIAALKTLESGGSVASSTNLQSNNSTGTGSDIIICSCCSDSLAGKVPFHRYNYKYCSPTCMHLHKEILEDE